jgi:hypothetical protein
VTDLKHDVPLAALAVFGAVGLVVGLPQRFLETEVLALVLAPAASALAAIVVCTMDRDVAWHEAAIAAALATVAAIEIDWRTGGWSAHPVWHLPIAVIASAGLAAVAAAYSRPTRSLAPRVAYALFVTGGIVAVLALIGLAAFRAIGFRLTVLPWAAGAAAGALLGARVPQLTRGEAVAGIFVAMLAAGLALVPAAPTEVPGIGIAVIVVVIAGMMAAVGAAAHRWSTDRAAMRARSGELPTAQLRDKA